MKLPHYCQRYLDERPTAGIKIAIGPTGLAFAERQSFLVMVLPYGDNPSAYVWPGDDGGALIYECGSLNDRLLHEMATELLIAGCPFVVANRRGLLPKDPSVFFYPGALHV